MEGELDTQEIKYSIDLDSSSENDDNSSESSKFQEDFLDTQELSYSVDLCDLSESDQNESDESIPELCLLKPSDFKRIGNTNWCQCGLCQPMKSEDESLCCLDTNEVPDDSFGGYY